MPPEGGDQQTHKLATNLGAPRSHPSSLVHRHASTPIEPWQRLWHRRMVQLHQLQACPSIQSHARFELLRHPDGTAVSMYPSRNQTENRHLLGSPHILLCNVGLAGSGPGLMEARRSSAACHRVCPPSNARAAPRAARSVARSDRVREPESSRANALDSSRTDSKTRCAWERCID